MFRNRNYGDKATKPSWAEENNKQWTANALESATGFGRVHPNFEIKAPSGVVSGYLNLKPLRELDKNFDIDIASCLQEYLAELSMGTPMEGGIDSTGGGGQSLTHHQSQCEHHHNESSSTNFTNAAILLQNSSNVYSRKVEYLYSLVYQTLQDLNTNAGNGMIGVNSESNSSRFKRLDPDMEQFECFDPDWNFLVFEESTLPLDTQGDAIDLPTPILDCAWMMEDDQDTSNINNNRVAVHTMGGGKNLFTPTFTSQFHEKNQQLLNTTMLNSSTLTHSVGKLSMIQQRKQQQQWMRQYMEQQPMNIGGGEEVTYRLLHGMCHVSDTGALLLPGTVRQDESHINGNDTVLNDGNHGMQIDFYNNEFGDENDHDDDNDNDGAGWEIHSPSIANPNGNKELLAQIGMMNSHEIGDNAKEKAKITAPQKVVVQKTTDTLDPWDLLDPHDVSQSKYRPMKTTITYTLPDGVDKLPSFTVTGHQSKNVKMTKKSNNGITNLNGEQEGESDSPFFGTLASSSFAVKGYLALLGRGKDNKEVMDTSATESDIVQPTWCNKMKPLSYNNLAYGSEFQYILESLSKRKAAERRKLKQQINVKYIHETAEVIHAHERFQDMYEDHDDDDYDNNNDGPAFDFAAENANNDDSDDFQIHQDIKNTEECHMDAFDGVFQKDTYLGADQKKFEELCRAHLKEFAKGAEKFAVESQLSKRVSHWQTNIENVLCEEEKRPVFNIRTYGNQIMTYARRHLDKQQSMRKKSNLDSRYLDEVEFASITKDKEPYEVCRTFLASLMLCNSENISLTCHATREHVEGHHVSSPDDLFIKILNKDFQTPLSTSYLATSIDTLEQVI